MPLKKIIKAGAITHLTDARFFAAYEVCYLGFCFDPESPDYISPQEALAIKGWISGPKIVAEFNNQDTENVVNIIRYLEPDVAELSAQYSSEEIAVIEDTEVLLAYRTSWEHRNDVPNNMLYVLLNNAPPDAALAQNWMLHTDSESALQHTMLQVKGSPEKETGVKSFDDIADLLEGWMDED